MRLRWSGTAPGGHPTCHLRKAQQRVAANGNACLLLAAISAGDCHRRRVRHASPQSIPGCPTARLPDSQTARQPASQSPKPPNPPNPQPPPKAPNPQKPDRAGATRHVQCAAAFSRLRATLQLRAQHSGRPPPPRRCRPLSWSSRPPPPASPLPSLLRPPCCVSSSLAIRCNHPLVLHHA